MRKRIVGVLLIAVIVGSVSVPVAADPPEEVQELDWVIGLDENDGLVAFWNITRADFCEWVAGGFVGPPPVVEPTLARFHETGQGVTVKLVKGDRPLELWQLDADYEGVDPCLDTDDAIAPWAVGNARYTENDNDRFASQTKTNSWGWRARATVHDGNGDPWHFNWTARLRATRDGEVIVTTEHFNLAKRGR